jgi:hypothetical protein
MEVTAMTETTWKAYWVESESDLEKALASYERVTDEKPLVVQISERAPEDLLKWVERTGLEVLASKWLQPHDVWLTHETKVKQVQLSLFA